MPTVGVFDDGAHNDNNNPEPLLAGVCDSERRRYKSLKHPGRARQYLASRWLLRRHLAFDLDIAPADVPLVFSDNGPPTLAGLPYHVGLSHSHALCLCLLSRKVRAGCDIEYHRPRRHNASEIGAEYFEPGEAAQLESSDPPRRLADFYRLWTLKEAGRKALGQGISGGLRTPSFSLRPVFECVHPPDRSFWTFAASNLAGSSGQYSLALAVCAPVNRIAIYRYRSDGQRSTRQPIAVDWDLASAPEA